jgi:hypothetical protein
MHNMITAEYKHVTILTFEKNLKLFLTLFLL